MAITDPQVTFAVASKAACTMTGAGVNADTVQIGGVVYTFATSPSAAYEMALGTNATTAAANIVSAVNADGTEANYYVTGTVAHPQVSAANTGGAITLTAKYAGDWAQAIALVDGMTNGTVAGASFEDITTGDGPDGAGNISTALISLQKSANAHVIAEINKILNGD